MLASVSKILILILLLNPVPLLAKVGADEKRDYERALELFKSGDESQAFVSATDFLRRYPKSSYADDAQYMLGELEFRRRNFEKAILELKKTLKYKDQGGGRVPDAVYLMAEAWFHLGDKEKAIVEWQALRRVYPKSAAAERAYVRILDIKGASTP